MLTGHVPFTGDTPVEIAMKHLSLAPEPPSALRPEVPHNLDAVVMRALAKDPDQRYGSAEEMDAELARVARGLAVSRETEEAMTQVLSGRRVADRAHDGAAAARPDARPSPVSHAGALRGLAKERRSARSGPGSPRSSWSWRPPAAATSSTRRSRTS